MTDDIYTTSGIVIVVVILSQVILELIKRSRNGNGTTSMQMDYVRGSFTNLTMSVENRFAAVENRLAEIQKQDYAHDSYFRVRLQRGLDLVTQVENKVLHRRRTGSNTHDNAADNDAKSGILGRGQDTGSGVKSNTHQHSTHGTHLIKFRSEQNVS